MAPARSLSTPAAGAAAMVAADANSSVARRAGAPLSASVVGTPPMDVVKPRRNASSPQSRTSQVGDGRKVLLLSRSLSGSRLNAEAPEFVPKCMVTFSSSLPGPAQGLGLSPPTLIEAPLSVSPVIVPPPAAKEVVTLAAEDALAEAPPSVDLVHAAESAEVVFVNQGHEQGVDSEHSHGPAVACPPAKPVVTEELKAKIVKQVEFYFSDTNLPTDNYLMKFVKKDPEGFVPIPVVASFRKIKNLVKNHGVVAAALRNSTLLVVSEDGKKVRRVQPLPDVDLEEVQVSTADKSRTVVAENLPEDPSIESMEQLFGKVGNVKMVRICQPEAANGANQTAAKHPKTDMVVSNKLHALVEFDSVELAEKAVAELTDERNWRSGLRVRLLLRRQFQSKHGYQQALHQKGRKPSGEGAELGMGEEESAEGLLEKAVERSGDDVSGQHYATPSDDVLGNEAGTDRDGGIKKGRGRGRSGRAGGGRSRGQHHHTHSGTPPQTSLHLISDIIGKPPPGPRMPDGTRGFSTGRGKPLAMNTHIPV